MQSDTSDSGSDSDTSDIETSEVMDSVFGMDNIESDQD